MTQSLLRPLPLAENKFRREIQVVERQSESDRKRLPNASNPYQNRHAITDIRHFYGRSRDISRVYDRITTDPPQCVNIVGDDKAGKSSTLIFLHNEKNRKRYLKRPNDCTFVLKRCDEWNDVNPEAFFNCLIAEIRESTGVKPRTPIEPTYECFRDVIRTLAESKNKLIVLVDDFDVITQNEAYPAEFFSFLRAIANNLGMAYVITSRKSLAETCVQDDVKESPFFNIFTSVTLGPFERDEAIRLIEGPSRREGVNLENEAGFIVYLAGCLPFLLQVACSIVFEAKLEKRELEESDLRDIRDRFVEESRDFFESIWRQLREDEMDVCEELACSDYTSEFDQETIKDLLDKGYILRDDSGIRLFCAGFKYFIKDKCDVSDETTSLSMFLDTGYKRNGSVLNRWLSGWMPRRTSDD